MSAAAERDWKLQLMGELEEQRAAASQASLVCSPPH